MVSIRPFRAFRPTPKHAQDVSSPPWDILTKEDVLNLSKNNPLSLLHVTRPDAFDSTKEPLVYAKDALNNLIEKGILERAEEATHYAYRISSADHSQLGLMTSVGCQDYLDGHVKKHEYTLRAKEDDRAKILAAHGACVEPVFYFCKDDENLMSILNATASTPPLLSVKDEEGCLHELWAVENDNDSITDILHRHPDIYVADGHHRSASAARYYESKKTDNTVNEQVAWSHMLAVVFPESQVKILAYNRLVKDFSPLTPDSFIKNLSNCGSVEKHTSPPQDEPPQNSCDLLVNGNWYRLTFKEDLSENLPVNERLDVALVQKHIFQDMLQIKDIRKDDRVDFVGGHLSPDAIEKIVQKKGWSGAVRLPSVRVSELRDVADAGEVMPPKSTWFDPKLRSGLVILSLENL